MKVSLTRQGLYRVQGYANSAEFRTLTTAVAFIRYMGLYPVFHL